MVYPLIWAEDLEDRLTSVSFIQKERNTWTVYSRLHCREHGEISGMSERAVERRVQRCGFRYDISPVGNRNEPRLH